MAIDFSSLNDKMDNNENPRLEPELEGRPFVLRDAKIPIPLEAKIIDAVLKAGDPTVIVRVVGGAIRDFLFHKLHTDQSAEYQPKDIDLATNLSEEEILARLRTEEAQRFHIRVKEKESVDTFGVVFCSVGGQGPFEVAPFRKDSESSDGRHPDRVERGTIVEDAMRRDFTINNLYYDFHSNQIFDYNVDGQGFKDIKARNVRCVGDPDDRFDEDKLRILRMVRFFSRYNEGLIIEWLDERTRSAINHFKNLTIYKGMSPERIQTEFLMGLASSKNTVTYLRNYKDLDLFNAVFGHRPVDLEVINRFGNLKNPRVVLAMLLRIYDKDAGNILNSLKYPNEISDPVQFLIDAMTFDPNDAVDVLKARDKRLIKSNKRSLTDEEKAQNEWVLQETQQDLKDLCSIIDDPLRIALIEFMAKFAVDVPSGEDFMKRGFTGPQIGVQQRAWIQNAFVSSLKWELTTRKLSCPSLQ